MQIQTIALDGGVQKVVLGGSFDVTETPRIMMQLHYAIVAAGQSTILDMREVDFMTSIGIGLLVACYTSLRNRQRKLVMYGVQSKVREVLRKANIQQLIPIASDEASAAAAVM